MREIKFRAWNSIAEFMLEWEGFLDYEADQMAIVGYDYRIFNDDEFELLQYTGRKDNNGIEFFVGDIVKIKMCYHNIIGIDSDCIDEDGKGEALYKVMFLENLNQFCLELINWTKFKPRNKYMHLYRGQIIGNIYENPELLEDKYYGINRF